MNDDQHARTELRRRAEERAAADQRPEEALKSGEMHRLIHELRVHQIELEMQNDELRHAQREIESSRARYFDLYDLAPVAYFTIDRKGLILEANLTGAKLLGVERITLPRKHLGRFVVKEDHDSYYLLIQKLFETGSPQVCEIRMIAGARVILDVRMQATIAVSGDGNRVARIVLVDITERRRAEEELKASREALRLANDGLEEKVKRRSQKLTKTVGKLEEEIKRRIQVEQELTRRAAQLRALAGELTMAEQRERKRLSNILHDHVQQIMAATKLQAASLREADPNDFHHAIDQIEGLLAEAIQITRSLSAELSPPILHDGGLKSGLQWLARWMLKKHGMTVDIESQKDYFPLAEDVRILLFEATRELLFNAVKHSGVQTVRVCIADDGTFLKITVADVGNGFDPNNQIGPGEEGAGFGLFSIQERIELIGGSFAIESALGKGACFTLTAPLISPADAPQTVVSVSPRREMPAEAAHDKIRLLLADDHAVMREGLARLLGQEPDIQIVGQASDGLEAVDLAEQFLPDVILMDFSMPGLNGMEATKAIKQRHPQIQVIGLSVYDQEERAKEMMDAGAVNYLNKSGPAMAVKAAIRACKK